MPGAGRREPRARGRSARRVPAPCGRGPSPRAAGRRRGSPRAAGPSCGWRSSRRSTCDADLARRRRSASAWRPGGGARAALCAQASSMRAADQVGGAEQPGPRQQRRRAAALGSNSAASGDQRDGRERRRGDHLADARRRCAPGSCPVEAAAAMQDAITSGGSSQTRVARRSCDVPPARPRSPPALPSASGRQSTPSRRAVQRRPSKSRRRGSGADRGHAIRRWSPAGLAPG